MGKFIISWQLKGCSYLCMQMANFVFNLINFSYVFLLNMRQQQGGEANSDRIRPGTLLVSSSDKPLENELNLFLVYIRKLPKNIQKSIGPHLAYLRAEHSTE